MNPMRRLLGRLVWPEAVRHRDAGLIGVVSVGVAGTGAGLITSVIVFGGAKAWAIFAAEAASEKGVLA